MTPRFSWIAWILILLLGFTAPAQAMNAMAFTGVAKRCTAKNHSASYPINFSDPSGLTAEDGNPYTGPGANGAGANGGTYAGYNGAADAGVGDTCSSYQVAQEILLFGRPWWAGVRWGQWRSWTKEPIQIEQGERPFRMPGRAEGAKPSEQFGKNQNRNPIDQAEELQNAAKRGNTKDSQGNPEGVEINTPKGKSWQNAKNALKPHNLERENVLLPGRDYDPETGDLRS